MASAKQSNQQTTSKPKVEVVYRFRRISPLLKGAGMLCYAACGIFVFLYSTGAWEWKNDNADGIATTLAYIAPLMGLFLWLLADAGHKMNNPDTR